MTRMIKLVIPSQFVKFRTAVIQQQTKMTKQYYMYWCCIAFSILVRKSCQGTIQ